MRNKIKTLPLLLFLGIYYANAQNTLNINLKDDTKIQHTLTAIRSLTFPSGIVQVNKTDGKIETTLLSNVRFFNFINLTTGMEEERNHSSTSLQLFPNPLVNGVLTIRYDASQTTLTTLKIIDLKGITVWQTEKASQLGNNEIYLNKDNWSPGVYIFKIETGNKIETKQLIINN